MKPIFVKLLIALTVLATLSGCYEVAPQQVEIHLSIQRNGDVAVVYEGQFDDMADWLRTLDKGEEHTDPAAVKKHAHDFLASTPLLTDLKSAGNNRFWARWHDSSNVITGDSPSLLTSDWKANQEVPRFVELSRVHGLESGFEFADSLERERHDFGSNAHLDPTLRKLLGGFNEHVVIDIDSKLVGAENSVSHHQLPDGRTRYEWPLRYAASPPIKFVFYFGDHDAKQYKLQSSPVGTDCRSLIGMACKCGPFRLMQWNSDQPEANAEYEIQTNEGKFHGCSDSDGGTGSIAMKQTGPCGVTILNREDNHSCKSMHESSSASAANE